MTRVLLIASSGGHLAQLALMRELWEKHEHHWVTFDKADARSTVDLEHVTWAYHPTTRNIPNLARNTRLAWRLMRSYRPDLVVSTGAAVAFPFFVIARLLGTRTVYVEVLDRVNHPTLTGALCYPLTDLFALQCPEQRSSYPDGQVIGWLT